MIIVEIGSITAGKYQSGQLVFALRCGHIAELFVQPIALIVEALLSRLPKIPIMRIIKASEFNEYNGYSNGWSHTYKQPSESVQQYQLLTFWSYAGIVAAAGRFLWEII